jgi:hypothetical protein
MTPADASVLIRVVPREFRGPGFTVTRNNVYQWVQGQNGAPARRLVGQLTDGQRVKLPVEQAARLFGGGGQAALSALSAVGSVASIATLGVCVVGFLHVSRSLKRVEARLDRVEQKLDAVAELVGVIDQKVDQLLVLGDVQLRALAELHSLMMSFQTAAVHRALETLDLRSKAARSPHRDSEMLAAARTLHEYRIWLAHAREADPERPAPARVELLRAEVLVALAEARARLLTDDAAFAALELESVLEGARAEVWRIRAEVTANGGVPSLLSCIVEDLDLHRESADIWAWLDRRSTGHATRELLRETARGYNDLSQRLATLDSAATVGAGTGTETLTRFQGQGLLRPRRVDDADAASLIAAYRLARSIEPALMLSTAIEIGGTEVRGLLSDSGTPDALALAVELEKVAA